MPSETATHIVTDASVGLAKGEPMVKAEQVWKSFGKLDVLKGIDLVVYPQQTFVLQLTNGCGMYLPTALAIEGGSYSGLPHVNKVGPEGGQMLVDHTVRAMQALFPPPPAPVK